MDQSFQVGDKTPNSLQVLWEDGERVLCRGLRPINSSLNGRLAVVLVAEHPSRASLDRLAHEFELRGKLDAAWALRPLKLSRDFGRPMLVLEDAGGEPLARLLGSPLQLERFLRLAIDIASALGKVHQCGLLHKDIKPANIVVDCADGGVRLTGFGVASRLSRERQAPEAPHTIAGTLAYMAPEQTGRMNRSVDARSDLYALGITFYEMLTGVLPLTATDPMGWVHCHVARMPVSPTERLEHIPAPVSGIVMKLLAKTPEDRYQTAVGIEVDLRHCLDDWRERRGIDDFPLGLRDTPSRLLIPEKLYGRNREISTLLACFDRIIDTGAPELVLVSGYSGIGKSSIVNELHKVLVPPRGLFASGKVDQYQRDIPYGTLVQALQSLVRSLLSTSDAELASWRDTLLDVLGANARLLTDLIPELKLIIGDQPPVPELPSQQAHGRFQLIFRRFLGAFARSEHPLTLFLDDLQWLDIATLDLLEDVFKQQDLHHLLLIGAYRDSEVAVAHPLIRKIDAIKTAGGKVTEITVAPLAREHVGQLIADALRCELKRAEPIADLVHAKTGGNPFFAIQFLLSLAEESLLAFDHDRARWTWDLERIHTKGYTDNIVDFMVRKLARLPDDTRAVLQQFACLGNIAEITTLSVVLSIAEDQVDTVLQTARSQEYVERTGNRYRFTHDRIQEAAYSLIPEELRTEAHLRIGRLLATQTPRESQELAIFDIVNQLNRGASLISSGEERDLLAGLNLSAGRRAKASTAYVAAMEYFAAGTSVLADDCWQRQHELTFSLELHRGECEFATGMLAQAEQRLEALSGFAADPVERANVACVLMDLYVTLDQSTRAVSVGLNFLRHLGIGWSPHPTTDEAHREYQRTWSALGERPIESLLDKPLLNDPTSLATLEVLTKLSVPALYTDANLLSLVSCRAVSLSIENGNCDASSLAFSVLAFTAGPRFDDYQAGFRFGQLGYDLVEKRGLKRFQPRIYFNFGSLVIPWTKHVREGRHLVRRAFDAARGSGDLNFEAHCYAHLNTNLLAAGDPLHEVQAEGERGLEFATNIGFRLAMDRIRVQLGLVRTLRGLTPTFGSFDEEDFDEHQFELALVNNSALAVTEGWYWIRKLQARFFAADYAAAVDASEKAQRLLWASPSMFETAEYSFYGALARAALCHVALPELRQQHRDCLLVCHKQLEAWAEHCPENFENRAALVGAEIARIDDRALDAMNLYEKAIRSAQVNGFVHNEALANELAASFYAARDFQQIAQLYLRNARDAYLRWGADGKVRQLDKLYPQLTIEGPARALIGTIAASVEHLDLSIVLKVSQAISGEMVLEKLVETLMRSAIEQAGAERGLLIFSRGAEPRIAAEAVVSGDLVTTHLMDSSINANVLPKSVLQYVLRTRENVILDNAAAESPFATDPYIRQRQARSILCLPLLNKVEVVGVLYLENNLAPQVFAPARTAVLKLLASLAAISLENTHLYQQLSEREARIRRLVDSNVIGIVIWDLDGRLLDANDAFLRMLRYEREDLTAGLRWIDMTPPEWQEVHARIEAEELEATGTMQAREKEFFRKDGSRVPVLIGAAAFEGQPTQGVAYILDLTNLKQAEEAARESERRYRQVQAELAHANRVATIGQITGSIAHEVNQPITAAVIGAQAALRWLGRKPPDLEEVRHALVQVTRNGARAGEVVGRIRDLIKKVPPRQDLLEINDPIREVIELTRSEASKNGVLVKMQFAEDLPLVRGDRVQLQQVVLNLIINAVEAMSGVTDGARELLVSTARTEPDEVLVAVRDSGPGLAPAIHERIFEAFYTTKASGLGIGLSICLSIIEAHGGRFWASSNEPRGAAFQFTLPPGGEDPRGP